MPRGKGSADPLSRMKDKSRPERKTIPSDYQPSKMQIESIAQIAEAKRRANGTYKRPIVRRNKRDKSTDDERAV